MSDFIEESVESNEITGLVCGVVKDGKLAWKKAYGYADLENEKEMKTDTIFLLASVSKTVTATAAMILYDKGDLDLDADINDYLPFKVTHPKYSDTPITAKMLLTHTSSISDESYNEIDDSILYFREGDEREYDLGSLLEEYFKEDGEFYITEVGRVTTPVYPSISDQFDFVTTAVISRLGQEWQVIEFETGDSVIGTI